MDNFALIRTSFGLKKNSLRSGRCDPAVAGYPLNLLW
jgi:hypothetical protein